MKNVTVIIPLYNGINFILETVKSVKKQTLQPEEIIIVDDGSNDGSPQMASSLSGVRLLQTDREGGNGPAAARRLGWEEASTSLVAFLDQDDLWHPTHLERMASLLEEHPRCSAAFSKISRFTRKCQLEYATDAEGVDKFEPWNYFPRNRIATPSAALIRNRALDLIGGWPEGYIITDLLTWLKLAIEGPMIRTEKRTVGKREHGRSGIRTLREEGSAFVYVADYIRFCEEALRYKKDNGQLSSVEEKQKLDIFVNTFNMTKCLNRKKPEEATKYIEKLEIGYGDEKIPSEHVRKTIRWVLWMLKKDIKKHKVIHTLGKVEGEEKMIYKCVTKTLKKKTSKKEMVKILAENPKEILFFKRPLKFAVKTITK